VAAEERAARPLAPNERLDPNAASAEELRRLPGIGPSKAAAIVAERKSGGPFRVPEDLSRVPGIGSTTVSRVSPYLSLNPLNGTYIRVPRALSKTEDSPVDVNRAQIKDLEQITGIGPALAARIVETRLLRGRFRGPEDLLLVPGIGPAILDRIRGQVRF
jgi:competence protein ComEA